MAVFCDCGPDQLGAARLVQLAALIVLHRRAHARGTELRLGLSGERADRWHTGELPELFEAWREAAAPVTPDREELDRRADPGRRAVGAGGRHARAGRARPPAAPAHHRERLRRARRHRGRRALRGTHDCGCRSRPGRCPCRRCAAQMLRRRATSDAGTSAAALSCPSFHGADRRLLLRGDRPDTLVVTTIPTNPGGGVARSRTHRFSGPVVAATSLGGKRLLALTLHGDVLRCEVVGKSLPSVERLEIALDHVELAARGPRPDDAAAGLLRPRERALRGARHAGGPASATRRRSATSGSSPSRRRATSTSRSSSRSTTGGSTTSAAPSASTTATTTARRLRVIAGQGRIAWTEGGGGRSTGAACTGARSRSTRATPCSASWPSCARRTPRW